MSLSIFSCLLVTYVSSSLKSPIIRTSKLLYFTTSYSKGLRLINSFSNRMSFFFFFCIPWLYFIDLYTFLAAAYSIWKFLGQRSNRRHRSDQSHCRNNTGSLTCCTTREFQNVLLNALEMYFFWRVWGPSVSCYYANKYP